MFKILLALHLLFAIFAIGPLVHAATTAARGLRTGDSAALASSSRMLKIYSYASLLVVIIGFGLMSSKSNGHQVAEFSEAWIWVSALLWLVAVGLVLGLLVPTLDKATELIGNEGSVVPLTAKVATVGAVGGVVGIAFAVIVFLMVYQPGK